MSKTGPDPMLLKYLETEFRSIRNDIADMKTIAAIGVHAKEEIGTLKAQLRAVWFLIGAIPVLGGALAFIGWIAPAQAITDTPTRLSM